MRPRRRVVLEVETWPDGGLPASGDGEHRIGLEEELEALLHYYVSR